MRHEMGLDGTTTEDDDALTREAHRIWREFWLNMHDVSYAAQGYHVGDGVTLWARKIDEHTLAQDFYNDALREKYRTAADGV